jgi:hypothetical protein
LSAVRCSSPRASISSAIGNCLPNRDTRMRRPASDSDICSARTAYSNIDWYAWSRYSPRASTSPKCTNNRAVTSRSCATKRFKRAMSSSSPSCLAWLTESCSWSRSRMIPSQCTAMHVARGIFGLGAASRCHVDARRRRARTNMHSATKQPPVWTRNGPCSRQLHARLRRSSKSVQDYFRQSTSHILDRALGRHALAHRALAHSVTAPSGLARSFARPSSPACAHRYLHLPRLARSQALGPDPPIDVRLALGSRSHGHGLGASIGAIDLRIASISRAKSADRHVPDPAQV